LSNIYYIPPCFIFGNIISSFLWRAATKEGKNIMAQIELNIDKELDLLTAIVNPNTTNSQLEVREIDDNILFHINPVTNELIMIQIYDFSVIRRKLVRHLLFLITKDAIRVWLNSLVVSFSAGRKLRFA
jgi:hypothetical protein